MKKETSKELHGRGISRKELEETCEWLGKVFDINRELNFERESLAYSKERVRELEKQKEEIYAIIRQISNPTHKQILHKRYVQGMKWAKISEEMNYEIPHLHRLHKGAAGEVCTLRRGHR